MTQISAYNIDNIIYGKLPEKHKPIYAGRLWQSTDII